MPTKLTDLEIDRVDFVDKGANPGAFITLFKRDNMAETPKVEATEAVAKQLVDLEKRAADAEVAAKEATDKLTASVERIAKLETEGRALVEKSERAEFIQKAAQFGAIVKADDFAPIYRKIHNTLDEKEREWFGKWLAGLNAAAKQSVLFKELGVGGADESAGAYEKLEQIADGIRKAEPKLTKEQAFAKATKTVEGQSLYSEYLKEGK